MDTIRTTVLCACCTAMALTLVEELLPMERFGKQIRLLMAVIMLTAILTPLTNLDISALLPDTEEASLSLSSVAEHADALRDLAVAESIRNALNKSLTEHKVNCTVTTVNLHIQSDGSICIDKVIISGNLRTGTVYLREWLGNETLIAEEESDFDSPD